LPLKVVVSTTSRRHGKAVAEAVFQGVVCRRSDRSLPKKDFVKAAQADCFRYARRMETQEELPRVIAEFVASKYRRSWK